MYSAMNFKLDMEQIYLETAALLIDLLHKSKNDQFIDYFLN